MPLAFRETPLARLMPFDLGTARQPDPNQPIRGRFHCAADRSRPGRRRACNWENTPADTPAVWKSLPPLYWMLEVPDMKPGVRVLAEHPSRIGRQGRPLPLIPAVRRCGPGAVPYHGRNLVRGGGAWGMFTSPVIGSR